jgi:hypothetical protein
MIIPLIDPLAIGRQTTYKHLASRLICRRSDRFVIVTLAWIRVSGRSQKTSGLPCSRGKIGAEGEGAKRGDGDAGPRKATASP